MRRSYDRFPDGCISGVASPRKLRRTVSVLRLALFDYPITRSFMPTTRKLVHCACRSASPFLAIVLCFSFFRLLARARRAQVFIVRLPRAQSGFSPGHSLSRQWQPAGPSAARWRDSGQSSNYRIETNNEISVAETRLTALRTRDRSCPDTGSTASHDTPIRRDNTTTLLVVLYACVITLDKHDRVPRSPRTIHDRRSDIHYFRHTVLVPGELRSTNNPEITVYRSRTKRAVRYAE